MSAHMKARHVKHTTYKVVIELPGKTKWLSFVPAEHFRKLEAFLEKYGESDSIPWEELAKNRIAKYKKSGLALRGARYREGLSQKELAKRTGISQENISKMENGQRTIGKEVAKKLAKALRLNIHHLLNP
jgi:DNA-binding XRE family transcriptional regulator